MTHFNLYTYQQLNNNRRTTPVINDLYENPKYADLTPTDMMLYSLYFDRSMASIYNAQNGNMTFVDKTGVFCVYTNAESAYRLHVTEKTITKSIKKLIDVDLIKVKRSLTSNKIYVLPVEETPATISSPFVVRSSTKNVDIKPKEVSTVTQGKNVPNSDNKSDTNLITVDTNHTGTIEKNTPAVQGGNYAQKENNSAMVDLNKKINIGKSMINAGVPKPAVQQLHNLTINSAQMYMFGGLFWKAKKSVEKQMNVSLILEDTNTMLVSGLPELFRRVLTEVQSGNVENPEPYVYTSFINYFQSVVATLSKQGLIATFSTQSAQETVSTHQSGTGKTIPLTKIK